MAERTRDPDEIGTDVEEAIDSHIRGAINDREFQIIVPKEDNSGNEISPDVIEEIAHDVADRFGGVTIYPTTAGCWVSDDGDLICDENAIIATTRDSSDGVPFQDDRRWFKTLAERVAGDLGQFAVMVSEDVAEGHFIEGDFKPAVEKGLRATGDGGGSSTDDVFRRVL